MGHHAYFDDQSSRRPQNESTPGSRLLRNESSTLHDLNLNQVDLHKLEQYILNPPGPFRIQDLLIHIADFSYENPPHYGLDISFDSSYGLPFIKMSLQHPVSTNTYPLLITETFGLQQLKMMNQFLHKLLITLSIDMSP